MSEKSTIKRIIGAALAVLLAGALLAPVALAKDVPIYVEYTGTGHLLMMPSPNPFDLSPPNLVQGDAKGSFGAKSAVIMSNFVPQTPPAPTPPCQAPFHLYSLIGYANAVISFQDGSQLFARGEASDNGWMCVDVLTGEFFGESYGDIIGGAGRFEGASGTYTAPFEGKQMIYPFVGTQPYPYGPEYPFISIRGSFEGTVTFD